MTLKSFHDDDIESISQILKKKLRLKFYPNFTVDKQSIPKRIGAEKCQVGRFG